MKLFSSQRPRLTCAFVLLSMASLARPGNGQASPTATRSLRFAIFGTANGTWTGLSGGRNVGVTAGLDVDLPGFGRFRPALDARGTYPADGGTVAAERNALGGLRLGYRLNGRVFPYAFGLVGRGRIDYAAAGYQRPGTPIFYVVTSSNVFSGGAGFDFAFTSTISTKLELQVNRQHIPLTASGSLDSPGVNAGLAWRPRFHRRRNFSDAD